MILEDKKGESRIELYVSLLGYTTLDVFKVIIIITMTVQAEELFFLLLSRVPLPQPSWIVNPYLLSQQLAVVV